MIENPALILLLVSLCLGIGWVLGATWNAWFGNRAEQDAYDRGWRDRAEIERRESQKEGGRL